MNFSINRILSYFLLMVLSLGGVNLYGQGCVAIRGFSGGGTNNLGGNINIPQGSFQLQTGYRYFKSFRHFRGTHEEENRIEEGTEVINHSNFLDVSVSYGITDRLYGSLTLPFVYHTRSSMYEHGGNPPNGLGERHETSSHGLADMRFNVGYWLFDPATHSKFNWAVAVGMKLPTGKYDYTDTFYNQGANRDQDIEDVVDQSIQPGDGGTGYSLELQGFHAFNSRFQMSANLYYLFNVTETNGVATRGGRSIFSSPDQYAVRLGVFYNTNIQGLSTFFGGRLEGVPSEDAIGGSEGYRRPGYVYSLEPGVNFANKNYNISINVPFAVFRNRVQSYEDKVRSADTNSNVHGDAAFADYVFNISVTWLFGGMKKHGSSDSPDLSILKKN